MIISASRRTDIPAYYSNWLVQRVEEGFCLVRNPINLAQISRISLAPDVVDAFVFWTKNPTPMMNKLDAFDAFPYYFQFSLTGYGRDVETNLPDKNEVLIPAFQKLATRLRPERVIWRYDPILFNDKYTPDYHLRVIEKIASALEGSTEKCVISFVDTYARNAEAMKELGAIEISDQDLRDFAARIVEIAGARGIAVATCAEKMDLANVGIEHNCCVDPVLIGRIAGGEMKTGKDRNQRDGCGCAQSIDIGAYNSCLNGCKYCYANWDKDSVEKTAARYDWTAPMLCDQLKEGEVVREREMKRLLVPRWGDGTLFE